MGYLNNYGVTEARRERIIRRTLWTLLSILVAGGSLFLWFKNYREEQRVKQFLATMERGDYQAAYTAWGCKIEAPCRDYDHRTFLEDWGPKSQFGPVRSYRLGLSRASGSGVMIPVVINDRPPIKLWVESKDLVVGFAPSWF